MKSSISIGTVAKISFALLLFSVSMFPKLSTILIIVLLFCWIYEKDFLNKISFLQKNLVLLILPILFLCYLLGMVYTDDVSYGWKKIETLFTFLLLPIIIPSLKALAFKINYKFFRKWYIIGIVISMLFCICRAVILFNYELYCRENNIILLDYPYTNYFFSSYLSYFMHYGYYSMYVIIGILFLLESIRENFSKYTVKEKLINLFLLLFLTIYVLMLYSKASILVLLMVYFLYGIYLSFVHKKKTILVYTFIGLATLIFILFRFIPYTAERFQGMVDGIKSQSLDPNSTESTQLRIFAWKTAKELIKESPWVGYGTGDGNNELIKGYEIRNFQGVLSMEINAHNQYFQTMLSIGLVGVLILILFFFQLFWIGYNEKDFNLLVFSLITSFVLLFESYFSTQAGVFYVSIISTLLLGKLKSIQNEN